MAEFYLITTIFNPARYASRYRLYEDFRKHIVDSGGVLVTVELAFGDQPFVVTERGNPRHIQLRSHHPVWYKENLVNVAIRRLPPTWTHVAWLDADIRFTRPDWLDQTLIALDKHPLVQMFTHAIDLGPNYESLKTQLGFAYKHHSDPAGSQRKEYGQPGYAWAARRQTLEALDGLIDWSILGSNDYYMALATIGKVDPDATRMPGSNYANMLLEWQRRFQTRVGDEVGCVATSLLHYWHGSRADRGYDTRWRILVENRFDPKMDLRYAGDGLLELTDHNPGLRDAIGAYFDKRNEDNPEL